MKIINLIVICIIFMGCTSAPVKDIYMLEIEKDGIDFLSPTKVSKTTSLDTIFADNDSEAVFESITKIIANRQTLNMLSREDAKVENIYSAKLTDEHGVPTSINKINIDSMAQVLSAFNTEFDEAIKLLNQ